MEVLCVLFSVAFYGNPRLLFNPFDNTAQMKMPKSHLYVAAQLVMGVWGRIKKITL